MAGSRRALSTFFTYTRTTSSHSCMKALVQTCDRMTSVTWALIDTHGTDVAMHDMLDSANKSLVDVEASVADASDKHQPVGFSFAIIRPLPLLSHTAVMPR